MAKSNKILVLILSLIMALSAGVAVFSVVQSESSVVYAASLTAPSVTVKSSSYNSAKISWKKVSAAKKYIVYRSTSKSGKYKAVKTISKNSTVSYTDKKLTCGKKYYYKVKAVNGKKTKTSSVKSVKVVPSKVTGLKLTSTTCGVNTIKFSSVSGASGYQVVYSSSKNGTYKQCALVTSTKASHSIGTGKTGYYKVRAYRTVNGKKVYGAYSSVGKKYAIKHSYGSYTVSKAATCTADGTQYKKCSICGKKVTKTIAATGHSYGSYKVSKAPTCSASGQKYKECSSCGNKVYATMAATGVHKYGNYTVTTAATCTEKGVATAYCTVCNKAITKSVSATGHSYTATVTSPTCTEEGYTTYTCSLCGDTYDGNVTDALGHSYDGEAISLDDGTHTVECSCCSSSTVTEECTFEVTTVSPTCTDSGYDVHTCTICGYSYTDNYTDPVGGNHEFEATTYEPTCFTDGYTIDECIYCHTQQGEKYDIVETPYTDHTISGDYTVKDDGKRYFVCPICGEEFKVSTCTVDLDKLGEDDFATFTNDGSDDGTVLPTAYYDEESGKLTLTSSTEVNNFDISGTAENLTVVINAVTDTDVKLCGVSITNSGVNSDGTANDCIKIKDMCTDTETTTDDDGNTVEEDVVPEVSISAKDGTENSLTVTASGGNAVESAAKLILKGHGTLNADTVSTSFDCRAKTSIKNLVLNITSDNRGIDTKVTTTTLLSTGSEVEVDTYYNIEFGANAVVTINSYDDGIRCKNMTFTALDETLGDVDTSLVINSEAGDGIQLEGGKGLEMNSGTIYISAGKYGFNCSQSKIVIATDADGNPLGTIEFGTIGTSEYKS